MQKLITELKRRNVFKVALAYIIASWVIMQVAAVFFPALHLPQWTVTFVAALLIIGFPVALILAWAFELTPEGIKPSKPTTTDVSARQYASRKLNGIIIGVLALAVVFLLFEAYMPDNSEVKLVEEDVTPDPEVGAALAVIPPEEDEALPNSVAVLLCDNLSPDPKDGYFAAGVHEEILNQLFKVSALNVIARTSMMKYAETSMSIPEIAADLNVKSVMECSVRFAGSSILVTAQLIDPTTNSRLWSETYPGDISDLSTVFAMQADIAINIANALNVAFSSEEQQRIGKQPTDSPEAYSLYLKASSIIGGTRLLGGITDYLDQAIAIDPSFALAYALKANLIANELTFGIELLPERQRIVRENAEKALSIDPDLAPAHLALAAIYQLNWQKSAAEATYQNAYKLYPSDPTLVSQYAIFKRTTGDYSEAIRLHKIATNIDPNALVKWHQLAVTYLFAGDVDAAATALTNSLSIRPNAPGSKLEMGLVHFKQGDFAKSVEVLREVELSPQWQGIGFWRIIAALTYERMGLVDETKRILEGVKTLYAEGLCSDVTLAMAHLAAHEDDVAYEILQKAVDGPEPLEINATVELKVNRWGNPTLQEPRFVELRNRMGFQD